jgi:hypothetical protein
MNNIKNEQVSYLLNNLDFKFEIPHSVPISRDCIRNDTSLFFIGGGTDEICLGKSHLFLPLSPTMLCHSEFRSSGTRNLYLNY